MTTQWTTADLRSQGGRTFVITGATSGIGRAAARSLSAAGAHVVLAVRDVERGRRVVESLAGTGEARQLDLADLQSVRAFADAWSGDIDVLINNAGIMAVPRGQTADGFELQLGTNHLGHFALTNLLLPHITERVVTVSSTAHRRGRLDRSDLNWDHRRYSSWAAYAQSKLANLLFAFELQRRLERSGSAVRSVAAHPGWAATNLQSRTGSRVVGAMAPVANRLFAQSEDMGALPTLYAATADIPGGSFVGPSGWMEVRGYPRLVQSIPAARDVGDAAWLWAESERRTAVPAGV